MNNKAIYILKRRFNNYNDKKILLFKQIRDWTNVYTVFPSKYEPLQFQYVFQQFRNMSGNG